MCTGSKYPERLHSGFRNYVDTNSRYEHNIGGMHMWYEKNKQEGGLHKHDT